MNLSIVSTLYGSEDTVADFVARAREAAREHGGSYEIILVNDGSPDDSVARALAMTEDINDLVIVDLSRNFGHHRALLTGIKQARGERIFVIDSDLEEDPDWLTRFSAKMTESGADMVSGVQKTRKGGWFERVSGEAFYRLYERLIALKTPRNPVTARILSRRFADALEAFDERALFLPGLFAYAGFDHVTLPVDKASKGSTTYSVRRRGSLAVDAITSFSSAPMRYVFYLGASVFALSMLASLLVVLLWIFFQRAPSGWTSLIVSIWMLGGLILSAVGVTGLYVGRIFDEVKRRPSVIIRAIHDSTR